MKIAKLLLVLTLASPFAIVSVTPADAKFRPFKAVGKIAKGAVKVAGKAASTVGKGAVSVGKGAVKVGGGIAKGTARVGRDLGRNPIVRGAGGTVFAAPLAAGGVAGDLLRGRNVSQVSRNAIRRQDPIRNTVGAANPTRYGRR